MYCQLDGNIKKVRSTDLTKKIIMESKKTIKTLIKSRLVIEKSKQAKFIGKKEIIWNCSKGLNSKNINIYNKIKLLYHLKLINIYLF